MGCAGPVLIPSCGQSPGSADTSSVQLLCGSRSLQAGQHHVLQLQCWEQSPYSQHTVNSALLLVPHAISIHMPFKPSYFCHKPLENPFLGTLNDCSPCLRTNTSPPGAEECKYGHQCSLWRGVGSSNALHQHKEAQVHHWRWSRWISH